MPRKRSAGDGTVIQLKDGRWLARLRYTDELGRPKEKSWTRKTEKESRAELKAFIRSGAETKPSFEGKVPKLGRYIDRWLEGMVLSHRPKSVQFYRQMSTHLAPIRNLDISAVTRQHWMTLRAELQGKGTLSPTTINHVHTTLKVVMNQAVQDGIIERNPVALVKPLKAPKSPKTFLDPAQAKKLLAATEGTVIEFPVAFALVCGLRLGESMAIRWRHVDLDRGMLLVQEQRQYNAAEKGMITVSATKAGKGYREVPLPSFLVDRLRSVDARVFAGPEGLVAPGRTGDGLDESNLRRAFRKAIVKAGVPKVRYHDLRVSAVSMMIALGVDPSAVMQIVGHSTLAMTMQVYAQAHNANVVDAMTKMGSLLAPRTMEVA